MKKAYTKPEIIFDDFSLATTIAATCGKEHTMSLQTCRVNVPGVGFVFMDPITSGCTTKIEDGDYGICYDVPTADTKLFSSF